MIGHLSWAYRIPAPLVPGVPTKTRLESECKKKFKPHYILFFRPAAVVEQLICARLCITGQQQWSSS